MEHEFTIISYTAYTVIYNNRYQNYQYHPPLINLICTCVCIIYWFSYPFIQKYVDAQEAFERALEFDPDYTDANEELKKMKETVSYTIDTFCCYNYTCKLQWSAEI